MGTAGRWGYVLNIKFSALTRASEGSADKKIKRAIGGFD